MTKERSIKEIDLAKAEDCRWYINHFELPSGKLTFVDLAGGRRVFVNSMSDEDAVLIANELYEMELEGTARAQRRILGDLGEGGGLLQ
jgi:hypothetical protein